MFDPILTQPGLLAGLAAIAGFLAYSALRDWQDARRAEKSDPPRLKIYAQTMVLLWSLAVICLLCWAVSGQSWPALGVRAPAGGWRSLVSWGVTGLAVAYLLWTLLQAALSRKSREEIRRQIAGAGALDLVLPTCPAEHRRFQWVALTAGITEEIIFRGFLIGVLALVFPLWLAAVIATAIFIAAHLYQGLAGMARIAPVAVLLAVLFVVGQSLWPVIILHIAIDAVSGGVMAIVQGYEAEDSATAQPA